MTISRYLISMIVGTLLSWGAWFLVIFQTDPTDANFLSFIIFYISLFLALVGTLSIIGFSARAIFNKAKEPYFRQVKKAFRHGLLFSLLVIICLVLQSQRMLNWWNLLILVMLVVFFELYFLTGKTPQTAK